MHSNEELEPSEEEFLNKKRCVIDVVDTNPDTNIGSAIVIAVHKLKSDTSSKLLVKYQWGYKRVEKKRIVLNQWIRSKIGYEPITIQDYQKAFINKYQLIVCGIINSNTPIIYYKGPPHSCQLYFFKNEIGLYKVVTNLKVLFNFNFLCLKCHKTESCAKNHHCEVDTVTDNIPWW